MNGVWFLGGWVLCSSVISVIVINMVNVVSSQKMLCQLFSYSSCVLIIGVIIGVMLKIIIMCDISFCVVVFCSELCMIVCFIIRFVLVQVFCSVWQFSSMVNEVDIVVFVEVSVYISMFMMIIGLCLMVLEMVLWNRFILLQVSRQMLISCCSVVLFIVKWLLINGNVGNIVLMENGLIIDSFVSSYGRLCGMVGVVWVMGVLDSWWVGVLVYCQCGVVDWLWVVFVMIV